MSNQHGSPSPVSGRAPAPFLALAAGCAAAAVAAVVLGPLGTRQHVWGIGVGYALFLAAVWLGGAAIVLAAAGAWWTRRVWRALAVVLVAAAAAMAPARTWFSARGAPPIHDVTTDLEHPPEYVAVTRLRTTGSNPVAYAGDVVSRQQRAAYGDVRPLIVQAPPARALALAADTAKAEGWTVLAQDLGFGAFGRLEATDTTFWFGRVDDIVVRIVPHEVGSRIDVRSSCRDDAADAGRNARRIRRFLAFLAERARAEAPRQG